MSFLISVVCLFIIMLLIIKGERIYHPLILFNGWWGLTIFVSGFGFFNLYIPSMLTYSIMLVGILSFNFPILIFFLLKKRNINHFITNNMYYSEKNLIKIIKILLIISVIILTIRSFSVLLMLLSGFEYESIRYAFYYEGNIMSVYEFLLDSWFVTPIIIFSMIYTSLKFFEGGYSKIILILVVIAVGLTSFTSGSRNIVLTFGLIFILSFFLQNRKKNINLTTKLKLIIICCIVISSLVYITNSRSYTDNSLEDILKTVVLYFSASYIYFEQMSNLALNSDVMFYGLTFFGGLVDILISCFNFIGFDIKTISSYISNYNQMYTFVGKDSVYNAFPTMLYTFIYDFGYIGIIFGPLLFGIISIISYQTMIKKRHLPYKGIYILIALMIFESPMKWEGLYSDTWIVLIMFLTFSWFCKKKEKVE